MSLHLLTNEGLTYLARRDRAAVGLNLDRTHVVNREAGDVEGALAVDERLISADL